MRVSAKFFQKFVWKAFRNLQVRNLQGHMVSFSKKHYLYFKTSTSLEYVGRTYTYCKMTSLFNTTKWSACLYLFSFFSVPSVYYILCWVWKYMYSTELEKTVFFFIYFYFESMLASELNRFLNDFSCCQEFMSYVCPLQLNLKENVIYLCFFFIEFFSLKNNNKKLKVSNI